jgi:3-oxoadipate enol-lactonase
MERSVSTSGATISYTAEGPADATPLLLINSIAATRDMWARQLPAFAATYRVIRYDARGHGRSSGPSGPSTRLGAGEYTLEQLGRDALGILDNEGVTRACVCGVSLGGLTAMWLGLHAPDRIRALVLANTAARIGTTESWTERIAFVRDHGMSAVADLTIPRWFSPGFRERDPDTVHAFRAMIQSTSPDGYLGCCAALRDADLREQIAGIAAPVLAIAGSADPATTPEGLHFIHQRIRGSALVTLDTAHLSNVECAAEFTSVVSAFLQRA